MVFRQMIVNLSNRSGAASLYIPCSTALENLLRVMSAPSGVRSAKQYFGIGPDRLVGSVCGDRVDGRIDQN